MTRPEPSFQEHLEKQRDRIVGKWLDAAIRTYPEDTAKFLKHQGDEFANPVGATLSRELENIFLELQKEQSSENLAQYVDAIVRVRAVQDFSPSRALRIFTVLKDVLRAELDYTVRQQGWQSEYRALEDKVDQLCMLAFDIYVRCREKVWEIRAREMQNRAGYLLRKFAGAEFDTPADSEPRSGSKEEG